MASTQNGVGPHTQHDIIDIRSDTAGIELKHEILAGLKCEKEAEKTLPTLLLYDEGGLKLFERITYLDEYYLTNEEIAVLQKHADSIAACIPQNAMVVELGSGNLRKVKLLLDALEDAKKEVSYYALDLMKSELERTLADVPPYKYVKCHGLHGTYDDGLVWMQRQEQAGKPKTIMSLGSSIGNFEREAAPAFLAQFVKILGPDDMMLIGLDACQEPAKVFHAYNDREGVTHEFTLNGLKHANKLLGYEAFKPADWQAVGEYDEEGGRHRAFVVPRRDLTVEGVKVKEGERIRFEESYKYSRPQSTIMWQASGAYEDLRFDKSGDYALHLLKTRAQIMYSTKPETYAPRPVPSLDDWRQLWSHWDMVTRQMIPENELQSKPIKLRNACIFYLGHIPTFFDIKLTEATGGKPTEPSYFYNIFERGIDPDVDNPEHCHAHSEIPDSWPPLHEILTFQDRVRARVRGLYESGEVHENMWTARAVWLGFEHEIMHMETLLYMLLQSDKTIPPKVAPKPDFEKLALEAAHKAVENEWFDIPAQTIEIGLDDAETPSGPYRHFGWDVEKPPHVVKVAALKAKGRPMVNAEYARYMTENGIDRIPASWATIFSSNGVNGTNGHANGDTALDSFVRDKAVRTVYGLVPLKLALDWPVSASYDELLGCAKYMGGRIPTLEEARSIYSYADAMNKREALNELGTTIPAVNSHLVNNGVQESPPSHPSINGSSSATAGLDPNKLFVNLDGANVGFQHWHPVAITQDGNKLAGQGEMGGLWEWTSSVLEKQEGYEPMKLYPAYSADFYDEKHNVVLGGSWATHPRLAGRKTFVNWYQRNYPYVWAGARIVKDA